MKKISIIVPVYNSEKTLDRCIESLIYQTYSNIEIILIDDCSNDDSLKICKKYENKYHNIKVISNKKNQGVSITRNKGIDCATGDYVCFVDSDDWVNYQYCDKLLKSIEENDCDFSICGFIFKDYVSNNSTNYSYGKGKKIIYKNNIFELYEKLLSNTLWNKIFVKKIIDKNKLKFDENLSMGEDLKFVLSYINVIKDKICIIDDLLYYYCKYDSISLMSNFGINDIENSFKNIDYMYYNLLNKNKEKFKQYCNIKNNIIKNSIYQIIFSNIISKQDKKRYLENYRNKYDVSEEIRQTKIIYKKNNILNFVIKTRKLLLRILGVIKRITLKYKIRESTKGLDLSNISIISQNCIGGILYHDTNSQFLSPTINCYMMAEDFITFVNDIEYYTKLPLKMHWENCPVGVIDNIKVYFLHYDTCKDAKEKWIERSKRINYDHILVLCTDKDKFNDDCYSKWKKIGYSKLLFTSNENYIENSLYFKSNMFKETQNIIDSRSIYKNNVLRNLIFNLCKNNFHKPPDTLD